MASMISKEKSGSFVNTKEVLDFSDLDTLLNDKLDLLSEKRASIREAALKAINNTLSMRFCGDYLSDKIESLSSALLKSMQKGETEQALALSAVALVSLSLEDDRRRLFGELKGPLSRLIKDVSQPTETRVEAINALSVLCFVCELFETENEQWCMEVFMVLENLVSEESDSSIRAAALQGWMLISTIISHSKLKETLFSSTLNLLPTMLTSDNDMVVRLSAAKFLVVLVELQREATKIESFGQYSKNTSIYGADSDEGYTAIEQLNEILDDKSKHKSQADRKKNKTMLRDMISYLEEGRDPSESVSVKNNVEIALDTWSKYFKLDAFRNILGEGFMIHLESNKNLMYVFDYFIDPTASGSTMTKKERRLSLETISRGQTKERAQQRRNSLRSFSTGFPSN